MEWISKILDVLKIPLKILLPSTWLFSAIMIFSTDNLLEKLNLLHWSNDNGFIFGLLFVISSCLIFAYIITNIIKLVKRLRWKMSFKRKTMTRILEMNPLETTIIIKLYNSIGYTCELDYSEPVVQGLLSQRYIYGGGPQVVSIDPISGYMPFKVTLQPFVYQTLDHFKVKCEKKIVKLQNKIEKTKKASKLAKLEKELKEHKEMYDGIFNGGTEVKKWIN